MFLLLHILLRKDYCEEPVIMTSKFIFLQVVSNRKGWSIFLNDDVYKHKYTFVQKIALYLGKTLIFRIKKDAVFRFSSENMSYGFV